MSKEIDMTWNHGNVDRAVEGVRNALTPPRPRQLSVATEQLAQAVSRLFRSESAASDAASALFGRGIEEVNRLMAIRTELIGHLNDLEGSEPATALDAFVETFDRYREAEWAFVRSYGGLLTPGAEGA